MIAIVVPVLNRPLLAQPLADNIRAATTVDHELWFVCSPKDTGELDAVRATGERHFVVAWDPGHGDFARKVNHAARWVNADWVFQAADDVTFEPGWDVAVLACAEATGALVIGTQDSGNPEVKRGRHSTHTLIARSYIKDPGASMDGPGTAFSTAYAHQWCDTELCQLAMARGVWAFCDEARVTHHHPFWAPRGRRGAGADGLDDTYRLGMGPAAQDSRVFRRRQRMWTRGRTRV